VAHLVIASHTPILDRDLETRLEALGAALDKITVLFPPSVHRERLIADLDAKALTTGPIVAHSCDLRVTVTID
jgi:hypothetical protein